MDYTAPLVVLIVAAAAAWTAWNTFVPRTAKRSLAGWLQAQALAPGRSAWTRNALLQFADRVAGCCCHGRD